MKRLLFLNLCLLMTGYVCAQEQFEVIGHMTDPRFEGKEIMLSTGKETLKTKVIKGKFKIQGEVNTPYYGSLILDQESALQEVYATGDTSKLLFPGAIQLFLQKGKVSVTGKTFQDVVVKGTSLNKEYAAFNKAMAKTVAQRNLFSVSEIKNLEDSLRLVYIEQHPNSYVTLPMLLAIRSTYFVSNNVARLEKMCQNLGPNIKASTYAGLIENKIEEIKNFGVGTIAPNFTITSDKGTPVSLSDYKGEYVLVEFWAHYCQPCIKEVPFLKEAYNAYKDKKFNILQISVDRQKDEDKWRMAIAKYTTDWDNAIDNYDHLQGAKMLYHVQGIPANFLIDPQGKIVAIDLKGDNLKNTLKSMLN